MRLIHTSDIHLGDPYGHPASILALQKVVNAVGDQEPDYLLLSGDVFDNQRIDDDVIRYFLDEISRAQVPSIVLPGNHDLMNDTSIYSRVIFDHSPENLYVFREPTGQLISFKHIDFWGKAMNEHSPSFRPVEGMPDASSGKWLVSMAHGHFEEKTTCSGRSSLIFPEDISSLNCDYLALGHWDVHTDISQGAVIAVYSGCPMGIGGGSGSVTAVELSLASG
ncbi:MAG: hypothetical protein BZY82_01305, partial [SAR202 cluster bacterium Io17-Chloro-G3]